MNFVRRKRNLLCKFLIIFVSFELFKKKKDSSGPRKNLGYQQKNFNFIFIFNLVLIVNFLSSNSNCSLKISDCVFEKQNGGNDCERIKRKREFS